jgi:hypothetical protein
VAEKYRLTFNPTNCAKTLLVLAVAYYFWGWVVNPARWEGLNGVDLFIHEAGHVFFRPLGEFLMIAGGSLTQILMPCLFVGYFFWQGQRYSAALVLFWVGENILNVSVYAADSINMQLPLLGGSHVIHDWNYLLSHLNILAQTSLVASLIQLLGTLVISAATGLGLWFAQPALTLTPKE